MLWLGLDTKGTCRLNCGNCICRSLGMPWGPNIGLPSFQNTDTTPYINKPDCDHFLTFNLSNINVWSHIWSHFTTPVLPLCQDFKLRLGFYSKTQSYVWRMFYQLIKGDRRRQPEQQCCWQIGSLAANSWQPNANKLTNQQAGEKVTAQTLCQADLWRRTQIVQWFDFLSFHPAE